MGTAANAVRRVPWNKGKIVGQKAPFKPIVGRPWRGPVTGLLKAPRAPRTPSTVGVVAG
jgi:hypothetical protein